MDAHAHFRGKKITVMGLGLLGRGVGDARYLAECGADLVVTDLKSREELAGSVAQLEAFPNIRFVLGEHRLEDFRGRDLVLKAAGVPLDSPYVAEARKNGIPVRMSADLFAGISGVPVIGVTGTRGKSTAAHMLHAILREAGRPALLGGNVRGVSTLALLSEATPEHTAVLELDSWQLQGWGEARMSPHVAVFTTFYPDHLNYYRGDTGAYLADKANIFRYQDPGDFFILGSQAKSIVEGAYPQDASRAEVASADDLAGWTLRIPGEHNRYDAACAAKAAQALGVDGATIRRAVEKFSGVPGRLEFIREVNGVKVYNDTTATTPEATLAALAARGPARTVLIMGGADKGLDMSALLARLPDVKKVILLAGTGTERICKDLVGVPVYAALGDAVTAAWAAAATGDVVIFSPAFASFGMFKNEFDRGDRFDALAKAL